ncbi:MAG: hypothetical protein IJM39_07395 [Firmicutes bacterium]|nr:hypothetical protein [Bacillota bacterium]
MKKATKNLILITMAAVLLFAAAACGNVPEDNKAPQNNAANNNAPADSEVTAPTDKSITLNGQEVSPRTVLITVSDDFTEEDLKALLKKHSLTVKYDYSSMKIYALTTDRDMNEKELAALLSALTKESKVLSAEPDQVIKLTDPIKPQLSTQ